MLTLYKAPRSESDDSSSNESIISRKIPAGRPYITKVNGKLVMARQKRERTADIAVDLLGEAFGPRTRIIRKRSKSLEREKGPLIINGVPYIPQLPSPITYSAPIVQQGFQAMPPMPPYVHSQFAQSYPLPYHPGPVQSYLLPLPKPEPRAEPKPTKEDFAKLVDMDTHFKKTSEEALKALNPSNGSKENEKIVATKTTITIVKHICANCGRLRSRKYHQEHPIKEGDVPAAAFCRKCQRDASSTSESSDDEREARKRKKKEKTKKKVKHKTKDKKKVVEVSSDEELPPPMKVKEQKKSKSATKNKPEGMLFDPKEDYIVVEEEISEDEHKPRGRKREKIVVEEYDGPGRPHSPSDSRAFPRRAHSAAERQDRSQVSRTSAHAVKERDKHHHRRYPSSEYTRVEVPSRYYDAEYEEIIVPQASFVDFINEVKYDGPVAVSREYRREHEQIYPKKIPVHYVEEVKKPISKAAEPHREQEPKRHPRVQEYTVEEIESISAGSQNRHHIFDERLTSAHERPHWEHAPRDHSSIGSRSSEARRRRRRERAIPEVRAPHTIDPEIDDEVVVVTEHFEYRRPRHNEESRRTQEYVDRTQEYIDRTTLDAHHEPRRFSPDDAARYFNDDWAGSKTRPHAQTPIQQPAHSRQSYRRDRSRQPSLSSESSYEYTISRVGNPLPPVPTPPSPLKPRPEDDHWESRPHHHEYRDIEESSQTVERQDQRAPQRSQGSERARSTSTAQSEHDRNRRAENSKTPSPPRSRERLVVVSEGSFSESGMTEAERMAELGARHVTFRDTPSERSVVWPHSNESTPTKKHDKGDSGWDAKGGTGGDW